jgi:hypothetical protein
MNNKTILNGILIGLTLFASQLAIAQSLFFTHFGDYHLLPNGEVRINDTQLKLSPTVKVFRENGKPGTLQNIKNGDMVEASVIKIGKRLLVDTLYINNNPTGDPEISGE